MGHTQVYNPLVIATRTGPREEVVHTLLCTSQGLVMAERSHAVIIMALGTRIVAMSAEPVRVIWFFLAPSISSSVFRFWFWLICFIFLSHTSQCFWLYARGSFLEMLKRPCEIQETKPPVLPFCEWRSYPASLHLKVQFWNQRKRKSCLHKGQDQNRTIIHILKLISSSLVGVSRGLTSHVCKSQPTAYTINTRSCGHKNKVMVCHCLSSILHTSVLLHSYSLPSACFLSNVELYVSTTSSLGNFSPVTPWSSCHWYGESTGRPAKMC